jgi:hypothetical protein
MEMTVPFLAGIAPTAFNRRSDCLLSFDCADGAPTMRSGQALSFVRNSIGTIIDSAGRVVTVAPHQPRITYGGAAFDKPGYLAESVMTNLILRSADPSNAYFTKSNMSVSTSTIVRAPDGTFAQKVTETAVNAVHELVPPALSVTAGAYGTFSVFIRTAERSRLNLIVTNGGNTFSCLFRLDLLTKATSTAGTGLITDSGIQALGDSWYRVWVTGRCGAAVTAPQAYIQLADSSDAGSYLGVVNSGLYIWGIDFQAGNTSGSFVQSHIPTTTAAVQREADILQCTPGFTIPENFTVYAKTAQPLWWNHTGLVPTDSIAQGGSSTPRWELNFSTATRVAVGSIYDGSTIPTASVAPTLGESLDFAVQFADLHTLGGRVRIDGGAGYSAYSSRTGAIADIGATRLTGIADKAFAPGNGCGAALQSFRLVSGLRTLVEMQGRR